MLALGAMTACGETPSATSTGAESSGPTPSVSAAPSGVPSSVGVSPSVVPPVASPRVSPSKGGGGKGSGTSMTLTGTVTFVEVEGGCWGLKADGTDGFKTYELMGADRTMLTAGARVRVTGRVRSDVATTCQIGTPFEVASMERI
jgi:hypothetical protein